MESLAHAAKTTICDKVTHELMMEWNVLIEKGEAIQKRQSNLETGVNGMEKWYDSMGGIQVQQNQ